jgi:hypothetical protein
MLNCLVINGNGRLSNRLLEVSLKCLAEVEGDKGKGLFVLDNSLYGPLSLRFFFLNEGILEDWDQLFHGSKDIKATFIKRQIGYQ